MLLTVVLSTFWKVQLWEILTRIWSIRLEGWEVVVKHEGAVIVRVHLGGSRRRGDEGRITHTNTHGSHLSLPGRWRACCRDTGGCRRRTGARAPGAASPPDPPRVSSCGGPTPAPRSPSGGCSAGAGVLDR